MATIKEQIKMAVSYSALHLLSLESMSSLMMILSENLNKEYKLGYHKAAKMAEIAVWAEIWAVTDLDPEIISSANITPFPSVAAAVEQAFKENPKAKVIIMMDGSVTIPKVSQ